MKVDNGQDGLAAVSFNDDLSCFVCATDRGFGVYSTMPFHRFSWRSFEGGGFSCAEMFGQTNVLALVGGRPSPAGFSASSVVLWDDMTGTRLFHIQLPSPINAIYCRIDTLSVLLDGKLVLYRISPDFSSVQYEQTIDTLVNPDGVCAISPKGEPVVACPGPSLGSIWVVERRGEAAAGRGRWGTKLIDPAHHKQVSCLAFNRDGSLLASASKKGTLVRVWATSQTHAPMLLKELRRGTLDADILSLSFCAKSELVSCASDSGTMHLFAISDSGDEAPASSYGFAAHLLSKVQAGQRGFARLDVGTQGKALVGGLRTVLGEGGAGAASVVVLVATAQGYLHCYSTSNSREDAEEDRLKLQARNYFVVTADEVLEHGEGLSDSDSEDSDHQPQPRPAKDPIAE
mmetsp:Transcript_12964/g.30871  ORF Transcript_12964/g.30871 Transcript_12964/m.30871 type:complete len:402 (-) Transcript_12964:253-1458(-)